MHMKLTCLVALYPDFEGCTVLALQSYSLSLRITASICRYFWGGPVFHPSPLKLLGFESADVVVVSRKGVTPQPKMQDTLRGGLAGHSSRHTVLELDFHVTPVIAGFAFHVP